MAQMKVAIVFPSGHFATTPCISSLAILLARRGIQVDIYTAVNTSSTKESSFAFLDDIPNLNLYLYFMKIGSFFENIPLIMAGFMPWFISKQHKKHYDLIIPAGIRGLFILGIWSCFTRIKFGFLCLELYLKKEQHSLKGRIVKALEGFFNRRAAFVIIQDELRGKILQRENNYQGKILIFPNAGLAETGSQKPDKDILMRFGINGQKVVLYAGNIYSKWAMTKELLSSALIWPDDWVLLLHSKARRAESEKQTTLQTGLLGSKIFISDDILDEYEYEALVKSVDVGIALYDGRVSENLYYLGYSSGKVSQYLRCGIPVIINRLPLIDKLVEDYNCGYIVDDLLQISHYLIDINNNYNHYSMNAHEAFLKVINPELYVYPIIEVISSLSKSGSGRNIVGSHGVLR
jgi:hypothetical protein